MVPIPAIDRKGGMIGEKINNILTFTSDVETTSQGKWRGL